MTYRLAVDVGGTFTDLVIVDDASGEMRVAKELSTPDAPEVAVTRVIDAAVSQGELVETRYFFHGTTVGLNTLLERSGAKIALLTTKGFRDVLEKRRSNYTEEFNPCWRPPPPLVPRRLRLPIRERVAADGVVVSAVSQDDLRAAAERLLTESIESVAIAFINSYALPDHELRAEEVLREEGFGGNVVLSHRVSREYREFERTATTVIDAYIGPRIADYLDRLELELRARGCAGELLIMQCGGGALTFEQARRRPFETILSGPVGGVIGGVRLAEACEIASAITADVGGTSFDTSLITDGRPSLLFQGEVLDLPIQTTWVDVRSIGAGAGSVAWIDTGGLPRVGPQSAGAKPGPAAYGHGGDRPTVTDAAVVLGLLGAAPLAGGMELKREASVLAFEPLADQLGRTIEEVARGALVIASTQMAGAIKAITVERGIDPRSSTLIPFGGAGGLFATLLAVDLGVQRVIVPPHAGNFSAMGLLQVDVVRTTARTWPRRLDEGTLEEASSFLLDLFREIEASTRSRFREECAEEVAFDLRYLGQEHTITVPAAWNQTSVTMSSAELASNFRAVYSRAFGHTLDQAVEVVTLRAALRRALPRAESWVPQPSNGSHAAEKIDTYSFTRAQWSKFDVVRRETLSIGDTISGPALLLEATSTIYIDAGFIARSGEGGLLVIERDAALVEET